MRGRFGIFLEFAIFPEEHGEFEISLLLSDIHLPTDLPEYPREAFDLIESREFPFPAASEGWPMPRVHWLPFAAELTLPIEVDVLLWVAVGNVLTAHRALLFRAPTRLPPGL